MYEEGSDLNSVAASNQEKYLDPFSRPDFGWADDPLPKESVGYGARDITVEMRESSPKTVLGDYVPEIWTQLRHMQEKEANSDLPDSTENLAEPGAGFVLKEGDPDFSHLDSVLDNVVASDNYYHNRNTGLSIQVSEAEVQAEDETSGPVVNIELGSDEDFTYSEFFNKQVEDAVTSPKGDLNYDQRALAELYSAELSEVNYSVDPGW